MFQTSNSKKEGWEPFECVPSHIQSKGGQLNGGGALLTLWLPWCRANWNSTPVPECGLQTGARGSAGR